jgi:hypothetical protein
MHHSTSYRRLFKGGKMPDRTKTDHCTEHLFRSSNNAKIMALKLRQLLDEFHGITVQNMNGI